MKTARLDNPHPISHRHRSGNEPHVITALASPVRTEFGPRNLNPTVAKRRDRGVLFCAGGETRRVIRWIRKGLRRWLGVKSLSGEVARDAGYSIARPSDATYLAQTLGRLSVSRRPGYQGVASALSVPTYRGWLLEVETPNSEIMGLG